MKNKIYILLIVASGVIGVQAVVPANSDYLQINKNLDIFTTLFNEVNSYYVDEVEPEKLINNGMDAMLESLDPYTNFISEEELSAFQSSTSGEYAGIGIMVGLVANEVRVTRVYKGFSANKAGIKIGDQILSINGTPIRRDNISEAGKLLKGAARSEVKMTIARPGSTKPLDINLQRQNISVGNVTYQGIYSSNIGYIKLEEFTTGAAWEVRKAVKELKDSGAESLVLDLRGNPGGLLSEAVNICSIFIPKGSDVVETRGRIDEWNKIYKSLDEPLDTEIPLAILIDRQSASAAEIVAGVMQDYDRAVLIGRNTFGKGLVQTTRKTKYNSRLKITTAKYYIPSGRCIQNIDYSTQDETGNVVKIADSLTREFETAGGRIVYDGSGLRPDIFVTATNYAPVTAALVQKGLLFNYASDFSNRTDEIPKASAFNYANYDYMDFIKWVSEKSFSYETDVENSLSELKKAAEEEKYLEDIEEEINHLNNSILKEKEKDLKSFQKELTELLTKEISSRYYFYEGGIEAYLKFDNDLEAAKKIISERAEYQKILSR